MVILENIDIGIDIDKAILQNIDIDKISNRFKFGISNRATPLSPLSPLSPPSPQSSPSPLPGSKFNLADGSFLFKLRKTFSETTLTYQTGSCFRSLRVKMMSPGGDTRIPRCV